MERHEMGGGREEARQTIGDTLNELNRAERRTEKQMMPCNEAKIKIYTAQYTDIAAGAAVAATKQGV